mmetsp:Transcript_10935/g.26824  ORF Transcript_10935/g.26824 Transcript_10935/m.26824 type:complete len:117 (-) Transcript_10935:113-463(-)
MKLVNESPESMNLNIFNKYISRKDSVKVSSLIPLDGNITTTSGSYESVLALKREGRNLMNQARFETISQFNCLYIKRRSIFAVLCLPGTFFAHERYPQQKLIRGRNGIGTESKTAE